MNPLTPEEQSAGLPPCTFGLAGQRNHQPGLPVRPAATARSLAGLGWGAGCFRHRARSPKPGLRIAPARRHTFELERTTAPAARKAGPAAACRRPQQRSAHATANPGHLRVGIVLAWQQWARLELNPAELIRHGDESSRPAKFGNLKTMLGDAQHQPDELQHHERIHGAVDIGHGHAGRCCPLPGKPNAA